MEFCDMNHFTGKKNKHFSLEVSFNNGFVHFFFFVFASYELEYNSVKIMNFIVFIIIVFKIMFFPVQNSREERIEAAKHTVIINVIYL